MKAVLTNINQLITLSPLAKEKRWTKIQESDLGIYENAWLAWENGKILEYGTGDVPKKFSSFETTSANHQLVFPGFIDSHTHPLFGGDRSQEFMMKLNGATYQEIAQAGGGIQSSVQSTRNATDDHLISLTHTRLQKMLQKGVTTIECKTGYGLNAQEELRHVKILNQVKKQFPGHLYITCLPLHAKGPEFDSIKNYVLHLQKELLPQLNSKAEWHVDAVDAFIENGYFLPENVENFFKEVKNKKIDIRLHADEFSDSGAAQLAADLKAKSADHLQYASDEGVRLMGEKGVVATFLPGTSLYSKIPYTQAKKFREANCPLAIASDFNPGSCHFWDLSLLAIIATLYCGMTPTEAISGITWIPAKSLSLETSKGCIYPQYDADFVLWPYKNFGQWLMDFGQEKPEKIWIRGQLI